MANYAQCKGYIKINATEEEWQSIKDCLANAGIELPERELANGRDYYVPEGCVEVSPKPGTTNRGKPWTDFHGKAYYRVHPNGCRTLYSYDLPIVTVNEGGALYQRHQPDYVTVNGKAEKVMSQSTIQHIKSFTDLPYEVFKAIYKYMSITPYNPDDYAA